MVEPMIGLMRTTLTSSLVLATTLVLAACGPFAGPSSSSSSSSSSIASSSVSSAPDYSALIHVDSHQPGDAVSVSQPLVVRGEAVGYWFFEASFPVSILDSNGNVLAMGPAQAQSDWMTEDFVPFEITLNFTTSDTTGTLVLANDNPSGMPENAKSISIPVVFVP